MRTFPPYKYQSRYDSAFLKLWVDTHRRVCLTPNYITTLNDVLEQLILDQATPLVQSSHPSKIGSP